MKKYAWLFALILALTLLFTAGCANGKQDSIDDTMDNLVGELEDFEPEFPEINEPVDEPNDEPVVEPTEEPVEEPEEPEEPAEPEFTPKGRVENEPAQLPKQWAVKELGTAADGVGSLTIRSDGLFVRYERDENGNVIYYAIDHMGNTISDQKFADIEELLPGVFVVRAMAEGINTSGIMLENGEMVLDCEAAIITRMRCDYNEDGSERFLVITYGTDVTDNQNEAFFYATKSMFSFAPEEGDTLYKGYAKVFDLETRSFLPDLTINNPDKYASKAAGNCFLYEDETGAKTVYGAKGEVVYNGSGSIDMGNGFFLLDYKTVISEQGEELFKSEDYLSILSGSERFLVKSGYGSEDTAVYDYYGNKLFSVSSDNKIYADGGGLFCGSNGDDGVLFDMQGNLVTKAANVSSPNYEGYGIWYFYSSKEDVKAVYYLANGTTVEPEKRYIYGLINEQENAPEGTIGIIPWNAPNDPVNITGTYQTKATDALSVCSGSEKSLVDCFSGNILLTGRSIDFANSHYIYVKENGVFTVYELTLEY